MPDVIQSVNSEVNNIRTCISVPPVCLCVCVCMCVYAFSTVFPVYDICISKSVIHLKFNIAVYLPFELVVFSKTFDELKGTFSLFQSNYSYGTL